MRARWLIYLSMAAGLLYLFSHGNPAVKGCAVGPLAVLAWVNRGQRRDAGLLALALGLSTAGDVLLDVSTGTFAAGLGAFLLAHIAYVVLFVRNRRAGAVERWRTGAGAAILTASAGLGQWIVPAAGSLAVPVVLYICALTAMVEAAILSRCGKWWLPAGAVLFLISDAVLAVNKFRMPVPGRDFVVWSTYYLGQCGLGLGYLESRKI